MPKRMDVGKSPQRTPAKHALLCKVVGRITGVAGTERIRANRLFYIDLTAGDAAHDDATTFWTDTSPGILIGYAAGARGHHLTRSVVRLYEINRKTYALLLKNLNRRLGTPTTVTENWARFDYTPRNGCGATVDVICADGRTADLRNAEHGSRIWPNDCVIVCNDPNSILTWAMRATMTAEVLQRTWMCTTFCTIGANAGGGPKRIPEEQRLRDWYGHIEGLRASLPGRTDLGLAAINGDAHQWAYAVTSPLVWRSSMEKDIRAAFGKFGYTMKLAWAQADPSGFKQLQDQLFRTKRELNQAAEGLWDD